MLPQFGEGTDVDFTYPTSNDLKQMKSDQHYELTGLSLKLTKNSKLKILQLIYKSLVATINSNELPVKQTKLQQNPINFDHVRSISVNDAGGQFTFKSKKGKVVGRIRLGLNTEGQMNVPDQTLAENERILGVYGSFEEH